MADQKIKIATFRPRARLLSLLGEQLISDQAVGLIELVKNAYDADATQVQVTLEDLGDPETTRISIVDNGCGMTLLDIHEKWLSPAIDHKERQKVAKKRSPLGRLPIGEKGVGRFAVHQLGHQLQLVSRAASSAEVVLQVNWDDFDSGDIFLDDLQVTLSERTPQIFVGTQTGTLLLIERARAVWTEKLVGKVQKALRRLQSPHMQKPDFAITFQCPDFPHYEQIDPGDITERAHYIFKGYIDENGILDYAYECHMPTIPERRVQNDNCDLVPLAKDELSAASTLFTKLVPTCGPFHINFYVWDRTREYLSASEVSRDDLDAMAGVSFFRDGLRVLPYGEAGNDWLDLDKDRINDPSNRIGNQQIIGFVEAQQTDTPRLRDKTNREGLIENAAFRDLRALVRATISVFTSQWRKDRPDTPKRPTGTSASKSSLRKARDIASAVASTARDDVVVNVGKSVVQPPSLPSQQLEPAPTSSSNGQIALPLQPDEPSPLVTQRQAMHVLMEKLEEAETYERQTVQSQEQREMILMHLAATGMASERVAHEFGRQVHAALEALSKLRMIATGDEATKLIRVLDACLGTLRNEFRVLAPYEANWRMQRTATTSIKDAIDLAVDLNQTLISEGVIRVLVEGDDFEVLARPASLVQVFDNLIHNAASWLHASKLSSRQIRIYMDAHSYHVVVSDNGPGIPPHARDQIFEAFFTLKNGGRGLGLYITSELLRAMEASIDLVAPPQWTGGHGASFFLQFPTIE